jgi:hypothetical protein
MAFKRRHLFCSLVFWLSLFAGCGLSFKFVAIHDESDFHKQYKTKISKMGLTRFVLGKESTCPLVHIGYVNDKLVEFSVPDTIQAVLQNAFEGTEPIEFVRKFTNYKNQSGVPDSNLKQYQPVLVSEEAFGKSDDELAALCDKYGVDALLMGAYNYCIEDKAGSVKGDGFAMPSENAGSTPSNQKEQVLQSNFAFNTAVFLKSDKKIVYATEKKAFGSGDGWSNRETKVAVRNASPDKIAWKTLSLSIRAYADEVVMAIGQYYRFERAKSN